MKDGTGLVLGLVGALAVGAAVRRGSRGKLVPLSRSRTGGDHPSYAWYVVNVLPGSDWTILSGFRTYEGAEAEQKRLRGIHGRRLKVMNRAALGMVGHDPAQPTDPTLAAAMKLPPGSGRWWARGEPVDPRGPWDSVLQAAKAAVHNAYWWAMGAPAPHLDEAVVLPSESPAAREWAPESEVVVFREYGLPDDFAWWEEVDRELARVGLRLYNESINPAVYALYAIPVEALPPRTTLRGRDPDTLWLGAS